MTPCGNQRLPADPEKLRAQSDEELVVGILSGSHDAITLLFDRYSRLVFRVAERILRDSSEAEEVLQTVFMDIFRTAAKFDPARGSVRIWLLQHAYFTSLSRRRRLTARHFYTSEEIGSVVSEIVRHSPLHDLNLLPAEALQLVGQALLLVEEHQRRAIELTYFEGLTAEEIAARTGESVVAVRHNLYRGLAKLRERLAFRKPNASPAARQESSLRREAGKRVARGVANVRA